MKRIIASGLIALMIMSIWSVACDAAPKIDDGKLERGSKNALLGWTEVPKTILDTTKEKNLLVGLTLGTLEGIINAFARTVSGVVDVGTLPVGEQGEPAVKPAMVD